MNEQNTDTKNAQVKNDPAQFWGKKDYKVSIELPQVNEGEPFVFYLGLMLNKDAVDARQVFAGLKPDEKIAATHEYYTNLIAVLSTRAPEGLPGFPDIEKRPGGVADAIREFFAGDNALKRKVIAETVEQYFTVSKRTDF